MNAHRHAYVRVQSADRRALLEAFANRVTITLTSRSPSVSPQHRRFGTKG